MSAAKKAAILQDARLLLANDGVKLAASYMQQHGFSIEAAMYWLLGR